MPPLPLPLSQLFSFLPSCLIYPSQPVSLLQHSNGCSLLRPSLPRSVRRSLFAASLLPVRSIVTVLSVFDGLSVYPSIRPSDRPPTAAAVCSARALHCKSPPSREGLNILFLAPRRRKTGRKREREGRGTGEMRSKWRLSRLHSEKAAEGGGV